MKQKRFLFLYMIFLFLFAYWMINANQIVIKCSGLSSATKIDFTEDLKKDSVYYDVERLEFLHDLSETVTLKGWTYILADQDPASRTVSALLKSDENCYELKFQHPEDPQLYKLFGVRKDVAIEFPGRQLEGKILGFFGDFSIIPIEDGIYELYIYCQESEESYGLADTGIWVEKSGNSLSVLTWESEVSPQMSVTQRDVAIWCIDRMEMIGDEIEIVGWTYVNGQNCETQKVYVQITDSTGRRVLYNTDNITRSSVAEVYNNKLYELSGYQARFPMSSLADGECTLRFLVENEGEVWRGSKYTFVKHEDEIEKYENGTDARSGELGGLHKRNSDRTVEFCLDEVRVANNTLIVKGWAFANELSSAEQQIFIELTDTYGQTVEYTTAMYDRIDVAEEYGGQYQRCGFQAQIPFSVISNGDWTMRILATNGSEVMAGDAYSLFRKEDFITCGEKLQVNITEREKAVGEVDSLIITGQDIELSGWAFAAGKDCAAQKVYVQVTDSIGHSAIYSAHNESRPDVAKYWGEDDYLLSGYTAHFPQNILADGECTLRLLVENGGAVWNTDKYIFNKSANEIQFIDQTADNRSRELEVLKESNSQRAVLCCLDNMSASEGVLQIEGWAYAENLDSSGQKIYLAFTNSYGQTVQYSTRLWDRPDIAKIYDERYKTSGFGAQIPISDVSDGTWTLQIVVENSGEVMLSTAYSFVRSGESFEIVG